MLARRIAIAACVALMLASGTAQSEIYTGNRLVSLLSDYDAPNKPLESGVLIGYVAGVVDSTSHLYCGANGATIGQIIEIVRKQLMANPELWNRPGNTLITGAMAVAFPCPLKPLQETPKPTRPKSPM
jgi:hypothetical protein